MALQERAGDVGIGEAPRNLDVSWLQVGRVVYGWTDRRDPSIDLIWWRQQRARVYSPAPPQVKEDAKTSEATRT